MECKPVKSARCTKEFYKCNLCGENKALEEYALSTRKCNNFKKWRCLACKRPACRVCGERPERDLTYHIEDAAEYRCIDCTYPPCVGCQKARDRREANSVDNLPVYKCKSCARSDACVKSK